MTPNERPEGQRFSLVYDDRGQPTLDSPRFRRRLAAFYWDSVHDTLKNFASIVHQELGVNVPYGTYSYDWTSFFNSAQLRDVLDTITLVTRALKKAGYERAAASWCDFVQRSMHEENLSYQLDSLGGVHFNPDPEFIRARIAAIHSIEAPRYKAVLREFEAAFTALDATAPDGKRAIGALFESVEILIKLICGNVNVNRLGKQEVNSHLKPVVDKLYAGNATALRSATQMIKSLGEWADAAHWYRHGQKSEEPTPPPLDFAVLMVTAGAGYLRWLAVVDGLNQVSS